LFYDWWNIFVRLVEPDRHMEAITSRPLLLHAIATRGRHARQTTITVASSHARAIPAAKALRAVAIFLRELAKTAEQLTGLQRWRRILVRAFQVFLLSDFVFEHTTTWATIQRVNQLRLCPGFSKHLAQLLDLT